EQAGNADYFTAMNGEIERRYAALATIALELEQHLVGSLARLDVGGARKGDILAQHQAHHVGTAERIQGPGIDQPAVAQHGDAVGNGEDLIKEMGDENDRQPARLETANHFEQTLHLISIEAC